MLRSRLLGDLPPPTIPYCDPKTEVLHQGEDSSGQVYYYCGPRHGISLPPSPSSRAVARTRPSSTFRGFGMQFLDGYGAATPGATLPASGGDTAIPASAIPAAADAAAGSPAFSNVADALAGVGSATAAEFAAVAAALYHQIAFAVSPPALMTDAQAVPIASLLLSVYTGAANPPPAGLAWNMAQAVSDLSSAVALMANATDANGHALNFVLGGLGTKRARKFPWAWVLGGTAAAVALGVGIYVATRKKHPSGGAMHGTVHGVSVERVHLDRGGYDRRGRYFGVGEKLYFVESGKSHGYYRAKSAREAREKMLAEHRRLTELDR